MLNLSLPRKHSNLLRQTLTLIAVFTAFFTNVLANIVPPGGLTIGEIANTLFQEVLITPANYAFAIWGVIYLGLGSLAIYQFLPRNRDDGYLRRMGYTLVIASVAQVCWVYVFLLRFFVASFFLMVAILVALIWGYLSLGINGERLSRSYRWFVQIPWSLYLGWISIATIVNGATALTAAGWNGGFISPQLWTIIMVTIGAFIAATVTLRRFDPTFSWVVVWALVAIALRHRDTPAIAAVTGILGIILAAIALWQMKKLRKLKH